MTPLILREILKTPDTPQRGEHRAVYCCNPSFKFSRIHIYKKKKKQKQAKTETLKETIS